MAHRENVLKQTWVLVADVPPKIDLVCWENEVPKMPPAPLLPEVDGLFPLPENGDKSTAVRSMPSWDAPLTPEDTEDEAAACAAKPEMIIIFREIALFDFTTFLDWTKIAGLTQNIYKPANVGVVEEDVVVLPMLDSPVWTAPPKNEGTCGDDGFSVVELNLGVLGTTLSSVASSNCPTWDISLYYINAMPIWHKYWNFYILYYHYELKCRTNSRKFGGTNIKEKTYFFFGIFRSLKAHF